MPPFDLKSLLERYNFSTESYALTGLRWPVLVAIYDDHVSRLKTLENACGYLQGELRGASKLVHSTRGRVKDAQGLLAKIIRKRIERPQCVITLENYRTEITDLIGLRVLHHFKRDWFPIDRFIQDRWDRHEPPKAYVRDGDPVALLDQFRRLGLKIEIHPNHYRSVHYLIKHETGPSSFLIAEVQVRTVFEEAWSEIDHMIRYPYGVEASVTNESRDFFNRVAGSADEMASFIQDHFKTWEQSASRVNADRTPLNTTDIAVLSRVLSMNRSRLQRELSTTQSLEEEAGVRKEHEQRHDAEVRAMFGRMNNVLRDYYPSKDSDLDRYAITIDGVPVETCIYTSPERVGLSVNAKEIDVAYSGERDVDFSHPDSEYGLKILKYLRDRGVRFWNAPVYRLREATFEGALNLSFSVSHFFLDRFVCGLLEDEIIDSNIEKTSEIAAHLPLRDRLLPKNGLRAFNGRVCAGGSRRSVLSDEQRRTILQSSCTYARHRLPMVGDS